ncbi:hypothetical protein H2200_001443 [Cladophialophora chaetospira]|uniref:CCHC-type domain-containing protein n=1 Tax=Cladophialophora chaetospira TaxID=386627 RepID=A0AA39CN17_9EURO|nr:hypothetical protein H2200_001443 [Cladophialophora chaetospira]
MAPNEGFGNNRLRTGFRKMPPPVEDPETSKSATSPGASVQDAIEISDDDAEEGEVETSDDDGGMLINIDGASRPSLPEAMDIDDDEGESPQPTRGREPKSARDTPQSLSSTGREAHTQLQGDLERYASFAVNKSATHTDVDSSGPLLRDLSRSDLELQIRYAFFDADPRTIDLKQPAVCLSCLQTGHAERNCPEVVCTHCSDLHSSRLCPQLQRCPKCREKGHTFEACRSGLKVTTVPCDICGGLGHIEQTCLQRFFPSYKNLTTEPLPLWICCSNCASRSHLVGDCPGANQTAAARWSLKGIASDLIFNLSEGKGMERREEVAANRGLRPEGLKIRGRAGLHNAGVPTSTQYPDNGDEDEQFLRPKVRPRGPPRPGTISMEKRPKKEKTANSEIAAPQEKAAMPNKTILTDFVKSLNKARRWEGKSQIDLVYDGRPGKGSKPYLVDSANPAMRTKVGADNEQKQIVWDWVGNGRQQSRTKGDPQIGEAYLVSEAPKLTL